MHSPGHSREDGISGDLQTKVALSNGFHVFAVDWRPDRITWHVDSVAYHEVKRSDLGAAWVFDHPFYLLLNLAIGGWLGGAVSDRAPFPADFTVDYVRWFEQAME